MPQPVTDDTRRPAEGALLREHLARVLDIAEDGILMADAANRVVLFNQGAAAIFGYTPGEVLGRPLELLLPLRFAPDHQRHMAEFARSPVATRRMGERRAVFGRRKDGTEFPAEVSISKLDTPGGMLFTAIVRDVTERKLREEDIRRLNEQLEQRVLERTAELRAKSDELQGMTQQLWQAAKLATLGELAASIAHELNNPLATVSLRVEEVLTRTPPDDPRRRPLEVVEQEVERMANLVANLLQFGRRGREEISTVEVPDELRKALELVDHHLRRRGIEVVREPHPEVPTIFGDRQKLRQVFLNLLTNAADAMPAGGRISLRVVPDALPGAKKAVRIEFADTGAGIAPEHLARVTEPFFTTKEEGKGTGLGLAICRRVVEEHGGTLRIASELRKGTTVALLLPVTSGTNAARVRGRWRPDETPTEG